MLFEVDLPGIGSQHQIADIAPAEWLGNPVEELDRQRHQPSFRPPDNLSTEALPYISVVIHALVIFALRLFCRQTLLA